MYKNKIISILLVLLLPFFSFPLIQADALDIIAPDVQPFGISHEDLQKSYWKLIVSLSANVNPTQDRTGEMCSSGQANSTLPVFFLTGSGGGKADRVCQVPAGKGVFIMLSSMGASFKEFPSAKTESDLLQIAKADQKSLTKLSLTIDGNKTYSKEELLKYRKTTNLFKVEFPVNSIFGVTGPTEMVSDDTFVVTEPIYGTHTIAFNGELRNQGQTNTWDVKYTLIAK